MRIQAVAVVGAGPGGLAAAKNLRDENFDVTIFERRNTIGGVWAYDENPKNTSTLLTTLSNVTKYRSCFTDFPVPDEAPAYLLASQVKDYILDYANHFNLLKHVRYNSMVTKVVRDATDTKWCVHMLTEQREEVLEFDKVLFCNGPTEIASMPDIAGRGLFKGKVLHVQAFKDPNHFAGERVLVVGLGNSAADTSTSLVGHADKIYLSHRRGANLVPRVVLNKPLDLHITRRLSEVKWLLAKYAPRLSRSLNDAFLCYLTNSSFKLDPSWRIHPTPSAQNHQPVISDTLVSNLAAGNITSVHGLRSYISADTVELDDSTQVKVDAIIFCTGYIPDGSLLAGHEPIIEPQASTGPSLVNLYQNIIHPDFPFSIAYIAYCQVTEGAVPLFDLVSMAVAQIWAGNYALPSRDDMLRTIDMHHKWVTKLAVNDTVYSGIVQEGPWLNWLNEVADTGVNEHLGYGWKGWLFWLRDMRFCNILMTGVVSSHCFRLFDGRRKKWDGSREAILRANENAKHFI